MSAMIVRATEWSIVSRLAELGCKREEFVDIVRAAVAAWASCTDNDPPGAKGFETWRWGVRRAREIKLQQEGWGKDDTGGFCTIVNDLLKIRIAVMNTDEGTGDLKLVAQNRSRKGANSERAAAINEQNNQYILAGTEDWPTPVTYEPEPSRYAGYTTFHLCIFVNSEFEVRAELSILSDFEAGYFTKCIEKILIIGDGDWEPMPIKDDDDESGQEFLVEVRRK